MNSRELKLADAVKRHNISVERVKLRKLKRRYRRALERAGINGR